MFWGDKEKKALDDLVQVEATVQDVIAARTLNGGAYNYRTRETTMFLDHEDVKKVNLRIAPEVRIGDDVRLYFDCDERFADLHTDAHERCVVGMIELLDDKGDVSYRVARSPEIREMYLDSIGQQS